MNRSDHLYEPGPTSSPIDRPVCLGSSSTKHSSVEEGDIRERSHVCP